MMNIKNMFQVDDFNFYVLILSNYIINFDGSNDYITYYLDKIVCVLFIFSLRLIVFKNK